MQDWVRFERVFKSFSEGFWLTKKAVIKEVSFALKAGRTVGFVGPNGAGKTTIMKLLLGFIRPDSGLIHYPKHQTLLNFKHDLGYLPERPYYYGFLNAEEFLKFHWQLAYSVRRELSLSEDLSSFKQRAEDLLNKVKLWSERNKKLASFSKGMLQRIGLCSALIHDPKILILDEPMSGLDPDGRFEIRQILLEQKKLGKTLFFSSHLIEDVEYICDDLLIIHEGNIIYCGPIQSLKEQMGEHDLYVILNRLKVGGRS